MTDLAAHLLTSIETHGKSVVTGIYKLYPHETKKNIDEAIVELVNKGWIIHRKSMVVDGDKVMIENVRRSSKQYYSQLPIFDATAD